MTAHAATAATGTVDAFPRAMSTDTAQEQIRTAMAALAHLDLADVNVVFVNGTATVVGSVARKADRDEIAAALRAQPGVLVVIDQLQSRTD